MNTAKCIVRKEKGSTLKRGDAIWQDGGHTAYEIEKKYTKAFKRLEKVGVTIELPDCAAEGVEKELQCYLFDTLTHEAAICYPWIVTSTIGCRLQIYQPLVERSVFASFSNAVYESIPTDMDQVTFDIAVACLRRDLEIGIARAAKDMGSGE